MTMETLVRERLVGRNVAVIGNAPPASRDYSAEIDSHDVVIRMNNFRLNQAMGSKFNYWAVNCGRKGKDAPLNNITYVLSLGATRDVLVPRVERTKFADAEPTYTGAGFHVYKESSPLEYNGLLAEGKKPTVGLAIVLRLLQYGVQMPSLFGFAGGAKPKYHCGRCELYYMQSEPRVSIYPVV